MSLPFASSDQIMESMEKFILLAANPDLTSMSGWGVSNYSMRHRHLSTADHCVLCCPGYSACLLP